MLDQYGWQLEIGSPATISRADHVGLLLLGTHGTVIAYDGERVSLELHSRTSNVREQIVSIPPNHLEYGHTGPAQDRDSLAQATATFGIECVQNAVNVAVSDGLITKTQAKKVVSAWQNFLSNG